MVSFPTIITSTSGHVLNGLHSMWHSWLYKMNICTE